MQRGFNLIEFSLVIIIILLLLALIFPVGVDFYKNQQLQAHSQQIIQTLQKAQLKAMASKADSDFGVHFDSLNKKYILFKGGSYLPGDSYNEKFDLPSVITITGPSEVIFSKSEGEPSFKGYITVSSNGLVQVININKTGRISLEFLK